MSAKPKEIIFEEEARDKLCKGVDALADVIAHTLGPKGRNVGLDASWGAPKITNDGNSIVDDVELKDQFVNMGISLGKEVANKIKEKSGDGTTTGILLLRSLVKEGIKNISSGSSPIGVKRGMEKALSATLKEIEKLTIQVSKEKDILSIATASASGDASIGQTIADCFAKVGKTAIINIEEAKGTETTIEVVEGMQFDRGYSSAYFCNDMKTMRVEMNNAKVLVTDKKISSVQEIVPLLQSCAAAGKELLIISEDLEGDVLSTLVVNKLRGALKIAAVKAPGFGDNRKALLEDIAVLLGATLMCEDKGLLLKDATDEVLGSCDKIIITKDKTTLINNQEHADKIQERVAQIEAEEKATTSKYDLEKLQERKAKLQGGVCQIRVGAHTEPELKQKKQVFEDSLSSTRAALEEGVVAGGGLALLRSSKNVSLDLDQDEKIGANILLKACSEPLKQLATNSGLDASVVLEEVLNKGTNFGFNVLTEKVEDLLKAGVIDPAKVVKNSLIYSVSVAGVILLSEALIGDAEEDEKEQS